MDEPFAWESREFLRKLCIGKVRNIKIVVLFGWYGGIFLT